MSLEETKNAKIILHDLYRKFFSLKNSISKDAFSIVDKAIKSFNLDQQNKFMDTFIEELDRKISSNE